MTIQLLGFGPAIQDTNTSGPRRDGAQLGRARLVLARLLERHADIDIDSRSSWHRDRALEDGASNWHEDRKVTLEDVESGDFEALLPFVNEHGEVPVTLHYWRGQNRVDVRDPIHDSLDGPAYRAVDVYVAEELVVKVLSMTLNPEGNTALIHVQGEGDYHTA